MVTGKQDLTLEKSRMELQNILNVENANMHELQIAISTMDGVRAITVPEGSTPAGGVKTAEEVSNQLHLGWAQLRVELSKFMDAAFTTTGKALTKEKKDILAVISEGLTQLKKEFRLPSRVEVKPSESKRANEAWNAFRKIYINLAMTLLNAIQDLSRGSSKEAATTITWTEEEVTNITKDIQKATKEFLLIGMLVKHLYGKALTKAQLEFGHRPYNQAFEALKRYKVGQRLKSAKRKARQSDDCRREALKLLEEEQALFIGVVEKWEKECQRWRSSLGSNINRNYGGCS